MITLRLILAGAFGAAASLYLTQGYRWALFIVVWVLFIRILITDAD